MICYVGRILIAAFTVFLLSPACADELMVLWWQVGDELDEDGTSLADIPVKYVDGSGTYTTAAALGVEEARLREVSTGNYLMMLDPETDTFSLDSIGVPMVWQADVSAYSAGSPEYAFVIELGNYESGTWAALATSEAVTYSDLVEVHNAIARWSHAYSPEYVQPWIAEGYTVPEPSSGLLIAAGAVLLGLRRRRKGDLRG